MPSAGAIVFDLFGTLLDIGSLRAELMPVIKEYKPFLASWSDRLLMYMLATAAMRRYEPFEELADHALAYAARAHHVDMTEAYRRTLVDGWRYMRPYGDVAPTIKRLREAGYVIATLTNATPEMASAAVRNAGLSELVDTILSADSIRAYKPDPRVYELVTSEYENVETAIFVTSEGWDATGAAEFGLKVVWCNRNGSPPETLGANPTWTISGLRGLCDILAVDEVAV